MKYLNKFELVLESTPLKILISIRNDSKNYLPYLIDNGFNVSTRDNLRYIVTSIDKKGDKSIHWKDVKYDIVQYLEFMDSKYNLEFIEVFGHRKSDKDIFNFTRIFRNFEEIEKQDDFLFTFLNINFTKNWKRKVNESMGKTHQYIKIEKIVNDYLQYLIDARFIINIDTFGEEIKIQKYDNSRFDWNDVKYDIIPFMEELLKFRELDISGSRTGIIFVNYSKAPYGNNKFINIDEIISDNLEGTMIGVVIELKSK